MIRLVALLFAVVLAVDSNAQNKVFCEIIEQIVNQKKTRIYLDYGQDRRKTKDIRLNDEDGDAEIFASRVEALNMMSALGWKFEQAYVKVSGDHANGTGSTSATIHYLLSKEAASLRELNGLMREIEAKKRETGDLE